MTLFEHIAKCERFFEHKAAIELLIRDAKSAIVEACPYKIGQVLPAEPRKFLRDGKPMSIEKINVSYYEGGWTWHLSGKELRADGSVGLRHGSRHIKVET